MARKKLTKKAKKVSVKVKRKSKVSSLTVAKILKQLPKQIKKELTVLKKQAGKLTAALKKAEKKKKIANAALTKQSTAKKFTAAKKVFNKINQTIAKLTSESEVVSQSAALLSEKQAAILALNGPVATKQSKKSKKTVVQKKSSKKPKSIKQTVSDYDVSKTTVPEIEDEMEIDQEAEVNA
jgi:hypothetical protein